MAEFFITETPQTSTQRVESVPSLFTSPGGAKKLLDRGGYLETVDGKNRYKVCDNIPIFTERDEYWCNVDRAQMQTLIQDSEKSGDWLAEAKRLIPRYVPAFEPLYRADAQFLFPMDANARILDAGAMWGGLTVPISQYCKEIFAVDKTYETLRFLQTRAKQLGRHNIRPVVSSIHTLPFPDDFFDGVVLNGVLEWLAMDQDVVLEKHWDGEWEELKQYSQNPTDMQLNALREIKRVLKPGGFIYCAIENRTGLQYFVGHPDDHMNVRFITFMPRAVANYFTKRIHRSEYRTYVYSPPQLKKLFETAGYESVKLHSVYPHYGRISQMTPSSIFHKMRHQAKRGYNHLLVYALTAAWRLIPYPLDRYLSPSLSVIASKGKAAVEFPRLLSLLNKVGVIPRNELANYELMLSNNRFGNGNSTNFLVSNRLKQSVEYFVKVARKLSDEALPHESRILEKAGRAIKGSDLEGTIPELLYFGEQEGITMQVCRYVKSNRVDRPALDGLRRVRRFAPSLRFAKALSAVGRRAWISSVDASMTSAARWLAELQRLTESGVFHFEKDFPAWLQNTLVKMEKNGLALTDHQKAQLSSRVKAVNHCRVPLSLQHGDFDICNVLRTGKGIFIVDFEHGEDRALPFFDLANLIFSPLVQEWRLNGEGMTLAKYAVVHGWEKSLTRWAKTFWDARGLAPELLPLLPVLGVLEQTAKQYPGYRDPHDYPMFGKDTLAELIEWQLPTTLV